MNAFYTLINQHISYYIHHSNIFIEVGCKKLLTVTRLLEQLKKKLYSCVYIYMCVTIFHVKQLFWTNRFQMIHFHNVYRLLLVFTCIFLSPHHKPDALFTQRTRLIIRFTFLYLFVLIIFMVCVCVFYNFYCRSLSELN